LGMLQMLLAWLRWVILDLSSRFSEDLMCSVDLSRERSMFHFLIALPLLSASLFTSFMHFLLAFCTVFLTHFDFHYHFLCSPLPNLLYKIFLTEITIKWNGHVYTTYLCIYHICSSTLHMKSKKFTFLIKRRIKNDIT
jgi:hypothetical protein